MVEVESAGALAKNARRAVDELRVNMLVAIELGDEIKQCPPQVIPPGGTAGFDLFFSSDEPTQYQRTITYTINGAQAFTLQGPKTGPGGAGALLLPPYGELTCTLTYTPSALDEEQSAMLALTHPKLGEWLYRAKGMGHAPSDMPVTRTGTRRRVRSPCEIHSTSRSSSTLRSSSR
jgi:hypothetical protein